MVVGWLWQVQTLDRQNYQEAADWKGKARTAGERERRTSQEGERSRREEERRRKVLYLCLSAFT